MKYPKPTITTEEGTFQILSFDEFRVARGLLNLSNQVIDYNIEKDNLDTTTIGRFRYIIWNDKAQSFNMNYKKARQA